MQVIKKEIRDAILESAKTEFARRGFSDASIRAIAAGARTSVGNLYKYYAGKEELFLALVLPVTDECIGMVSRTFDIANENLDDDAAYMADYVSRNREIFRILTSGPPEHYTAFLNRFVGCVSVKLRDFACREAPEAVAGIRNPAFFDAVAAGYVGGLRPIMEDFTDVKTTKTYIVELMNFMFGDFVRRLPAGGPEAD